MSWEIVINQWCVAYNTKASLLIFPQKACLEYKDDFDALIDKSRAAVVAIKVQFVNGTMKVAAFIVVKKV